MSYPSPLEKFYYWESNLPDKVFLRQPINGQFKSYTYFEAGQEIRKMATYLGSLNLDSGSRIGIYSKNCAYWILTDLAIMMSGFVSVPLYPNLNSESLKQILEHSETKVLFVGKLDNYEQNRDAIDQSIVQVSFSDYPIKGITDWDTLVKNLKPITQNVLRKKGDLATIIYTSGTTGRPKGVMHSFNNLAFATYNAMKVAKVGIETRFVSYLPLCHIAERMLIEMGSLYSGGSISFIASIEKFKENIQQLRPTVFMGVPRIWSKFQQMILQKVPQKRLNLLLSIPLVSYLVKSKIKRELGLSEAKNIFVGGAPMPPSLLSWFKSLDINIQEAYAMTENSCYSHVTLNDHIKIGFVGKALPGVEVKLGTDKEVLIRHEGNMLGYYKDSELTKEAFAHGFLKTGDTGEIDQEGFLKITGRVKDIFKTSKGKYVSPLYIEQKFAANHYIEQLCIVGENLPQPMLLINLSSFYEVAMKNTVEISLLNTLKQITPELDDYERVAKIIVLNLEWTTENGFLTPSLKIKRNILEKYYQDKYPVWLNNDKLVIWES